MLTGQWVHVECQLTSAFHTRRQGYANLWKCAPFVLGSTLRGALLTALITTAYDDLAIQNKDYKTQGPAAPFFTAPLRAYFTFGRFEKNVETQMESHARIAVERGHGSVAEGALLSVEAVKAGTPFEFEVLLPGDDGTLAQTVCDAVALMSEVTSLGSLRSLGMGQFVVQDSAVATLDTYTQKFHVPPVDKSLNIYWKTPYVLAAGETPWTGNTTVLAQQLHSELQQLLQALAPGLRPPVFERVDTRIKPDFVGRWSFENGTRENRLVAWPGSAFTAHVAEPGDWDAALRLAQVFGWGEWAEWGFGRWAWEVAAEHAS